MSPDRFFHEIYGPGLVYSGFAPPGTSRWLPQENALLLGLTGNQIVVAGAMPILCSAGSASRVGLDLLGEAGFKLPEHLFTFHDVLDYQTRLNELVGSGMRIVVQHVHLPEILSAEACWIEPRLLSWLNDKGNLSDLVPSPFVPQRIVLNPDAPDWRLPDMSFPFLLKVASPQSTGGGAMDVRICRDALDLERAAQVFRNSERVVAEEWLPARRFLCLNYSVDHDADVNYLGSAEIINDAEGRYLGNWLGEDAAPSAESVAMGRLIAKRGGELGYRGCLCVDIAELPNGSIRAFDLNFRACGSTVPLLLFNALRRATGARVARLRTWSLEGKFRDHVNSARSAMRDGLFVPLACFDPQLHGIQGASRISGLLLGASRAEVERHEAELVRRGWH